MSRKTEPTIDELINTLKRSFIPTLLIEGSDDAFIYRYLKDKFQLSDINLQVCGCRSVLFEVFKRRNEFKGKNIIFIADKDSYRFVPIPEIYSEIIFTKGYSIENDLYHGSTIESLIDQPDLSEFNKLREVIGVWFAGEVEKILNPNSLYPKIEVASHIDQIVPKGKFEICPIYIQKKNCIKPSSETLNKVLNNYNLNVRGKQLFQILSRIMSKKGRFSRFDHKNLVELALKLGGNTNLEELMIQVKVKLDST